jgi:ATP-dependent Clp endopeptidase proteolytic subunit ClpP
MKYKYLDIIEGKDNSATFLIYGAIGCWDVTAAEVLAELNALEKDYKTLHVRINSPGGEVFAGLAIFNALKRSKADVQIHIDGLAASMGSVIASARQPLRMSKYARLMIHSASISLRGNKTDLQDAIKELEEIEDSLATIYAERTGLKKGEIKANYFDGKDHWFSADEALKLKLIDAIEEDDDSKESEDSSNDMVQLFASAKWNEKETHLPKNQSDMFIDDLKKRASFAGKATDAELLAQVEHLETEAAKVADLEAKLKAHEAAAAKAETERIAGLVDAAVKDGRIKEPQREAYVALLAADTKNGEAVLAALTKPTRIAGIIEDANSTESTMSYWEKRQAELEKNLSKKG